MLKQRQQAYPEAEAAYLRSLQLRRDAPMAAEEGAARSETERAAARQQAVAPSLLALGKLAMERGCASDDGAAAERHRAEASRYLEEALQACVAGYNNQQHPKVADCLEALGDLHEKQGRIGTPDLRALEPPVG